MTSQDNSRVMRKRRPSHLPVGPGSIALFRLGEQCNNACPMCSNSGRPAAFHQSTEELVGRVGFLESQGIRRVVVTGGEPTIHSGFWEIIGALRDARIVWDINTHGRSFADETFTDTCIRKGLKRAIVSFHTHILPASRVISGIDDAGHEETIEGIRNLIDGGVATTLNCVITKLNQGSLCAYLRECRDLFGVEHKTKIVFPSTVGKGGDWDGIHISFASVRDEVRAARDLAEELGLAVEFESFPNCILGDPEAKNMGRSGFGETHYLDDITGSNLYSITHIEAQLSMYPERCQPCAALQKCCGISESYAARFGYDELTPFTDGV